MISHITENLLGFKEFLKYFVEALGISAVYITAYLWATPHHELDLIRRGNVAAAIGFAGGILGFVIPLACAIAHAVSLVDLAVWGLIVLILQVLSFLVMYKVLGNLSAKIEAAQTSSAILSAVIAISIGIISAACLVP